MKSNAKITLGDLIVFNHSLNAGMFRVKEMGFRYKIGVVDAEIDHRVNQATQWVDLSSMLKPSVGQLKAFNALSEHYAEREVPTDTDAFLDRE